MAFDGKKDKYQPYLHRGLDLERMLECVYVIVCLIVALFYIEI